MATYTTNYNLKKPAASDYVSVGDINDNMDTLDTTIKSVSDTASAKQAQHSAITISVGTNAWSNKTASVTATGVTASNTVIVSPAPASMDAWKDAEMKCTAQATNQLTFTCETVPTAAISVNVVILS